MVLVRAISWPSGFALLLSIFVLGIQSAAAVPVAIKDATVDTGWSVDCPCTQVQFTGNANYDKTATGGPKANEGTLAWSPSKVERRPQMPRAGATLVEAHRKHQEQ
jgi:hypothetical protein